MVVSVCIATHNGEAFVAQQLKSILGQIGENDEVIISDDSSTDNTVRIIEEFRDNRIRIIKNQKFKNAIKNFESALTHVCGEIIFLADQDDIWLENKVTIMLNYLKKYDLVLSDCTIINAEDKIISDSFFKVNGSKPGLIKNILKNSYLGCTMAFKKKVLVKALPFPPNIPMHDWWIGLIGEAYFKVKHIEYPLIKYRRHGKNASSSGEKSSTNTWTKINYRIPLITGLISRF